MLKRGNRRELLADAAIEVLAREGGRGLTHRAVDREAEVPEGTTKNYWPTRESVFVAVARRVSEQHVEAMNLVREQAPEGLAVEHVASWYAAMLRRTGSTGRAHFLALFELHLEAVRRPEVRSALGEMVLANAASARYLHDAVGIDLPTRGAGLLDAGMLGAAMSMLSLPESVLGEIGFDDADAVSAALLNAAAGSTGEGAGAAMSGCAG